MSEKPTLKEIYLIRHGQTDYNLRGIVQGSGIDSSLNDLGRAQAKAFFENYKHIQFKKIYTSKLKRTIESVSSFLELGIPHEELEGLNEISWGIMEGRIPDYKDNQFYKNLVYEWKKGNSHTAAEGGESPDQVAERQKKAIEYILKNEEENPILIAMHGRAIRILLAQLSNLPNSMMDLFQHENLCLYRLNYNYITKSFDIKESCNMSHLKI